MIDLQQVTAVVVTKGDEDLTPVVDSLRGQGFCAVMVWDNSEHLEDLKVFGRYMLAVDAPTEYVYVQDDDCIVDAKAIAADYQPGELLCNVRPHHHQVYSSMYQGITLVGWGAIFPKLMVDFKAYLTKYPCDELFYRECDRIFTWLNRAKTRVVHHPIVDLPHALWKDRMGCEKRHGDDLFEIRRRLMAL
jgi:hypothetical protein